MKSSFIRVKTTNLVKKTNFHHKKKKTCNIYKLVQVFFLNRLIIRFLNNNNLFLYSEYRTNKTNVAQRTYLHGKSLKFITRVVFAHTK